LALLSQDIQRSKFLPPFLFPRFDNFERMTSKVFNGPHGEAAGSFDLFRLSKSKAIVDLAPNTLRAFEKQGLRFYRHGKIVFISIQELLDFIKSRA
jgi:hypothetical protein